jgi:hypothetical protein
MYQDGAIHQCPKKPVVLVVLDPIQNMTFAESKILLIALCELTGIGGEHIMGHGTRASEINKKMILEVKFPLKLTALKFFQLKGKVTINKPKSGI